jgi:Sugar (pentulose and hexulose) kinases
MRIIAVDVGTSTIKAGVFNADTLSIEGYASSPVRLAIPKPGYAELDPEELWDAFASAVSSALAEARAREGVAAIVMTTQMAGVVPVDRSGEPLSNILTWLDTRAAGHPRKLFAGAVRISGYSPLLLLKMLRVSGGAPGKLGKDPLPKYTWFAEEQAEVYARTWKFLDVKGYLLYKLTSRAVITVDEASITWLADTRNPHDVKWSDDLLRIFGVDREKLPEIVQPTDVVGELAPSAAKELNLASGTKVVAGCGDVPATAVGSGAVEDYEVHAYVGTGTGSPRTSRSVCSTWSTTWGVF